jgi:hypothetical protein
MPTFSAVRISKGNLVFPDKKEIDGGYLDYYKAQVIGYNRTRLKIKDIAGFTIHQHLPLATLYIESKGGMVIEANGFSRADALEIKAMLSIP